MKDEQAQGSAALER